MRHILSVVILTVITFHAFSATTRLSETTATPQSDGSSFSVKLSDDGRFAVFQTNATNLIAGDTNTFTDVVLKDRQTGELTCVSCTSIGAVGNGASTSPAISGDGRFVTFQSAATNLVAGDNNALGDVFVRDVATGILEIVSRATGIAGAQGTGASGQARLSSTGQFVAFASTAGNLVTGDSNASADIFIRDRATSATSRVSVATGGAQATGGSAGATSVAISGDGRYVVFTSGQQTLSIGDTNNLADAFLHDRQTTTTERLSTTAGTTGSCLDPAISADGSLLAFSSTFADLMTGDTNASRDSFYRARSGGALTRITASGNEANGSLEVPSINGDGSKIAFQSTAFNLAAGDANAVNDIYLLAVATGAISRISVGETTEANGSSTFPWIASNTGVIAFSSSASNLTPGDTNATVDTFANALAENSVVLFANGFED